MASSTIITDYLAHGTAAARPVSLTLSAGAIGIYYADDTGVTSAWNGTAWHTVGSGGGGGGGLWKQVWPSAAPTQASTGLTTALNIGSVTRTDTLTGVAIKSPTGDGSVNTLRGVTVAVPATPYTIRGCSAFYTPGGGGSDYSTIAFGFYNGSNKAETMLVGVNAGQPCDLSLDQWTDPNTFNSTVFFSHGPGYGNPIWWQLKDDGTSVTYSLGPDGETWLPFVAPITKSGSFMGAGGYTNIVVGNRAYSQPIIHSLLAFDINP